MSEESARPLLQKADELIGNREFDSALSILSTLEKDGGNTPEIDIEIQFLTGSALYERGDFDEAVARLEKVAASPADHPDRPEALLLLGYIHIFKAFDADEQQNEGSFITNIKTAAPHFQAIERDYPDFPDISEVYSRLGQCHLEMDDLQKAIDYYWKAKDTADDKAMIAFYLRKIGTIYQDLEEYPVAAELLRESLKYPDTNNGRAHALSNLGRISLFVEDDAAGAQKYFSEALELFDPKEPDYVEASHDHALYGMGEILLEAEEPDWARYYFEQVLRLNNPHTGNVELAAEALFDIAKVMQ